MSFYFVQKNKKIRFENQQTFTWQLLYFTTTSRNIGRRVSRHMHTKKKNQNKYLLTNKPIKTYRPLTYGIDIVFHNHHSKYRKRSICIFQSHASSKHMNLDKSFTYYCSAVTTCDMRKNYWNDHMHCKTRLVLKNTWSL